MHQHFHPHDPAGVALCPQTGQQLEVVQLENLGEVETSKNPLLNLNLASLPGMAGRSPSITSPGSPTQEESGK